MARKMSLFALPSLNMEPNEDFWRNQKLAQSVGLFNLYYKVFHGCWALEFTRASMVTSFLKEENTDAIFKQ